MYYLKIFCLALTIFSTQAFSKEPVHIITGSSNSSLSFDKTSSNAYDATFGLNFGYDRAFTSGLQFGGNFGIAVYSAGSVWSLAFGPGYNFNTDVENSFFSVLKFGFVSYHATDSDVSDSDTFLVLEIGKRFKLMENVSFVPGIKLSKILGTYSPDPTLSIELFRLSLVF